MPALLVEPPPLLAVCSAFIITGPSIGFATISAGVLRADFSARTLRCIWQAPASARGVGPAPPLGHAVILAIDVGHIMACTIAPPQHTHRIRAGAPHTLLLHWGQCALPPPVAPPAGLLLALTRTREREHLETSGHRPHHMCHRHALRPLV